MPNMRRGVAVGGEWRGRAARANAGTHRVEERQRQRDARAAQEAPARQGLTSGDEGSGKFLVHEVDGLTDMRSLGLEQLALHDLLDEGAHAVFARARRCRICSSSARSEKRTGAPVA